jgi:phiKZ-like phage internal head proteins
MSNFYQRKVAQESVGEGENNIDSLSAIVPVEENLDQQLADLASEDQGLDALAKDGVTLNDDIERTEGAVEAAASAEAEGEELGEETVSAVDVAQESIRRRWGIMGEKVACEAFRRSRGRTHAAGESWRETLKELYKRFVEFLKGVKNKIKDLRLKYFNAGKTAQKRGKEFAERVRKLGKKKSDNISGSFITKLSVDGKFDLDGSISTAQSVAGGGKSKAVLEKIKALSTTATAMMNKEGDSYKFSDGAKSVELFGSASTKLRALPQFEDDTASGSVHALPGNAYLQAGSKQLTTPAGSEEYFVLAFTTTGDSSTEKQIDTPATASLSKGATALERIGKDYEKLLQDFRNYEAEMDRLESAAEKAANAFDKQTEDDARTKLAAARTIADASVRNFQTAFRATNYVVRTVIDGLNGFVGAGIGAYESSK